MKTLRTKRTLGTNLKIMAYPFVILGYKIIYDIRKGQTGFCIFNTVLFCFFHSVGIFRTVRTYRTHWIRYGDGKVVIRRVSKKCVDGKAVGKWKNREDEFGIEEIEAYGISYPVLGYFLEHHQTSIIPAVQECFFRLKDGRMIGYSMGHYKSKEIQEFFDYISETTGLKFQKTAKLVLKSGKASEPAKAERD